MPEADSGSSRRSSSCSAAVRGTSGVSLPWARSRASGPAAAEAIGQRGARQPGQLAEGADPEALERIRQQRDLRTREQQRDRQRGHVGGQRGGGHRGDLRAPCARATGGRQRGEARGRRAEPDRPLQRVARGGQHALERAAVQRAQAAGAEPGGAGRARLDGGADALQRAHAGIPRIGHPDRVGRQQPQRRTARERLPQPQPGAHAVGLGRRRDLADQLVAPRLRGQGDRARRQHIAPAGGDGEREAREQDADDHEHMFACNVAEGERQRDRACVPPAGGGNRPVPSYTKESWCSCDDIFAERVPA